VNLRHPWRTGTPRRPRSKVLRRVRRGISAALLMLIPAGYLADSANQSRNVAVARLLRAERAGLVHGDPSKVQRAVYEVPVPAGASDVAYYEANAWDRDRLYVQFTTSPTGLAGFLHQLGSKPAALHNGKVTVTVPAGEAAYVPWQFPVNEHWAGMTLTTPGLHPDHRITVNLDNPERPTVYVVSSVHFAHRHGATPSPTPSPTSSAAHRPGPSSTPSPGPSSAHRPGPSSTPGPAQ
jgi:hypothetical protein